jgi:hypothetical protein
MGTLLLACPSCSRHAFARETRCPSCGTALRGTDGSVQRTAGAVLLGLSITAVAATNACGGGGTGGGDGAGGTASTSHGHGGAPVTASSGMGGIQAVSSYGAATTTTLGGAGPGGDAGGD